MPTSCLAAQGYCGGAAGLTGMNEGSPRLDDDCDLIVVAVAEPVEGHVGLG